MFRLKKSITIVASSWPALSRFQGIATNGNTAKHECGKDRVKKVSNSLVVLYYRNCRTCAHEYIRHVSFYIKLYDGLYIQSRD